MTRAQTRVNSNTMLEKFRNELSVAIQKGSLGDNKLGVVFIYQLMKPMAEALKSYIDNKVKTKNYIKFTSMIDSIGLDKSLYIAIRTIISNTSNECAFITLATAIANNLEFELKLESFKNADISGLDHPREYTISTIRAKTRQRSSKTRTAKMLSDIMVDKGFIYDGLDTEDKLLIGSIMIDLYIQATGFLKITSKINKSKKVRYYVSTTSKFIEQLNKVQGVCEIMHPIIYPMLVLPANHSKGGFGGFLTKPLKRPLIKDFKNEIKKYAKELDMPNVYRCINAIQNVAWRINKDVLKVFQHYVETERAYDELDIPCGYELQMPPLPCGKVDDVAYKLWKENNPEIYSTWKAKRRDIYNKNATNKGKRILTKTLASMANKFINEKEIYYCYDIDWRGRVYSIQSGGCPNPQGNDISKALLEFAKGKEIGSNGAKWLSFAGANSFGDDKISLNDRFSWAKRNEKATRKLWEVIEKINADVVQTTHKFNP